MAALCACQTESGWHTRQNRIAHLLNSYWHHRFRPVCPPQTQFGSPRNSLHILQQLHKKRMAAKRGRVAHQQQFAPCAGHAKIYEADVKEKADLALGVAAGQGGERHLILCSLCSRQRLHAHHGTLSHGTGKALDCSHGWRAPATFDACQLKLGRLYVIGLANSGVGQGYASSTSQVQPHPIRSPSGNPCPKKVRVFRPHRTAYRHGASQNGPVMRIAHRDSLEGLRFKSRINVKF